MTKDERKGPKCDAYDCKNTLDPDERDHVFCDPHWLMVPDHLQFAMFESYQFGQCFGNVKIHKAWFDAVNRASDSIRSQEKRKRQRHARRG